MNSIPEDADISKMLEGAYFKDCFIGYIDDPNQTAMDVWLDLMKKTPQWVNALMSLRNRMVSFVGLKNLGTFGNVVLAKHGDDYLEGDRVGIFSVYLNKKYEVILEDKDKHLDVKVSLYLEPEGSRFKVHITTVVHVKNHLGKFYMLFVAPMHKLIVPSSLSHLEKATR